MNPNDDTVPAGKHQGKRWSEVPKSYLEFVGNLNSEPGQGSMLSDDCIAELEKRKSNIKKFHILPSTINSASLCMINDFISNNKENGSNTGFYTYVSAFIENALVMGVQDDRGKVYFKDYMMTVEWGKIYPTIIRIGNKQR